MKRILIKSDSTRMVGEGMQTSNEIKIFFANETPATAAEASAILDRAAKHKIDCVPWSHYPYKPLVFFSIAYTSQAILLKYYVQEEFVQAKVEHINGEVFKDSCVEFFVSFDSLHYYNLEFNSLGVARVEYGQKRKDRIFLPEEIVKQIEYQTNSSSSKEDTAWELTLVIPFSVFINDEIKSLQGKAATANFYKCGDELPKPHFLAWSPIQSPEPDFHLPSFFGRILFQ